MSGTSGTLSSDSDVSNFTEAAALMPIFMESTDRRDKDFASFECWVVDFIAVTLGTSTVDDKVAKSADTGLFFSRVDFVITTNNENTCAINQTVPWRASACIVLWEVSLVLGTSLADISDDSQTRETLAYISYEMLVDTAWVDADALMHHWVILVAFSAFATEAVDRFVARFALAVESVRVEDFITIASITVGLRTVLYFNGGLAAGTVVRHYHCCQEE